MDTSLLIAIVLLILFPMFFLPEKRRKFAAIAHVRHKNKSKSENKEIKMEELAKQFIGKDCVIYTITDTSATLTGVVRDVKDGGLLIEGKNGLQAINLEYVTRIREYPVNKKGKKVSVILD